MQVHDSNVRVSVRKFETDRTPSPLPFDLAAIWQRIDWPLFLQISAALLHLAGGLWLLVLTAAYVQTLGWFAALPHAAFLPVYVFFAAYGGLRWQVGDCPALYRCTAANGLLVAIY
jgi:hypothetical protein